MAARTFTSAGVNNLWSNPANWDGGVAVPVNNDSVTIPSGQTCEFDVDQSGFANGIDGLTITGTLSLTRTAGTYYLKIKAAKTINGAGTFDCGTSVSPIPFASKHTITGGAGWFVKGNDGAGMTMTVYAAEPSIKTVRLTGAESAGATVLEVDTDVTGDIWADGDTIRIDNINNGTNSEERVIAAGGRAAGSITITAGLTDAKVAGTLVHLITRNVRFIRQANMLSNFYKPVIIAGGSFEFGTGYLTINSPVIVSGGTFSGGAYMLYNALSIVISGGIFSGHLYGIANCPATFITGGTFSGITAVFYNTSGGIVVGGLFAGCSKLLLTSQAVIKNAILVGLQYAIEQSQFSAFNMAVSAYLENHKYNLLEIGNYSESYDHNQIPGAYKAWTKGGITTSQVSVLPTGYTKAFITVLESATVEGYWQREITVGAGASVNIETQLRKDALMTYLPRAIIFNKASTDPFAGGAGLHTFTMTDSVNTWESDLYTYTNSGTEDVTLVVRIQGMNATGNLYSALDVEQINVDLTGAIAKIDVIDGLVDAIKAKTDQLAFTVANQVDSNSLTGAGTPADVVTALMAEVVEGTYTFKEILHIMTAVLAGKSSGGATANVKFRDLGDTKDRIDANVDANGNRLSVTLDGT